jgi:hypothetical protein
MLGDIGRCQICKGARGREGQCKMYGAVLQALVAGYTKLLLQT